MEIFKKNFHCNYNDVFKFYFLGDIHEGNCNHAKEEFKKAVEIIAKDKNAYWIGMGDYIEAITPNDIKRFDPVSIAENYKIKELKDLPYKQCKKVYDILKPIDKRCLALLIGNHEESYVKHNHSNVYERFVEMFESKPFMMGYMGFLKFGFIHEKERETANYTIQIAVNHGDGGSGYREGYPVNKLHDVFRWSDADVNIMGHTHQLVEDTKKVISVTKDDRLKKRVKIWGVSGCFLYTFLEGNRNYFEHKGRAESDIGMLCLHVEIKTVPVLRLEKIKLG